MRSLVTRDEIALLQSLHKPLKTTKNNFTSRQCQEACYASYLCECEILPFCLELVITECIATALGVPIATMAFLNMSNA